VHVSATSDTHPNGLKPLAHHCIRILDHSPSSGYRNCILSKFNALKEYVMSLQCALRLRVWVFCFLPRHTRARHESSPHMSYIHSTHSAPRDSESTARSRCAATHRLLRLYYTAGMQ
jgi:hypothetical protein